MTELQQRKKRKLDKPAAEPEVEQQGPTGWEALEEDARAQAGAWV